MKATEVKAIIYWRAAEDGGRKDMVPPHMRYCPVIVFENEKATGSAWSAEVYNTEIDGLKTLAKLSYLFDEAPFENLQKGNKFKLYEGKNVVADGEVL